MKRILSLVAILGVLAALSASAVAQAAGPAGAQGQLGAGKGGHKNGANRWKVQAEVLAKLNLTQEQKDKIKTVTDKFQTDQKALRKEVKTAVTDDQKNALKQKVKDLNQQYMKDLMAILTPDQQKQFHQEMRAEMQKLRQQQGGGGTPPPAGGTPH